MFTCFYNLGKLNVPIKTNRKSKFTAQLSN